MASDRQGLAPTAKPDRPDGHDALPALHWGDVFDKYVDALYTFVHARVQADSVDDIVQEVFTTAIIGARGPGPLPTCTWSWLVTIARSRIVDHFRCRGRLGRLAEALGRLRGEGQRIRQALLDESALPEDLCQQAELKALVQAALSALEPRQRACLHAKYYEGLTLEEVAGRLGTSRAAANSLLHRARQDLRQELLTMLADPTEIQEYRP